MALSMSASEGKHNGRHNLDPAYRATLDNVNPERTKDNVVLADESIRDAYDRLFAKSVAAYNAKQEDKHPERCIQDYYVKVDAAYKADEAKVRAGTKKSCNVPKTSYEYILQIGSQATWQAVPEATLVAIYRETFERLKAKTAGAIDWHQAVIHVDETTPHMHIDGIPYGTGCKRGLETQVSMRQALKTLGLPRLPDLQEMILRTLEDVAHEYGVERQVMDCERKHLDVAAFKQAQRDTAAMIERLEEKTAQVQEAQDRLESLQQRAEELEPDAESLAESTRYCKEHRGDAERAEELAEQLRAARERATELTREVEQSRNRVQAAERRNEECRGRIERIRELVKAARGRFEGLASQVRALMQIWAKSRPVAALRPSQQYQRWTIARESEAVKWRPVWSRTQMEACR